ncbi:hypothetical protein [Pedobacter sp. Leaf194]|uniref:hypothetical protein n=1 Tax=Pedobacter sp. Leaf194 TaxID=1736297 RepID=UPI0012F85DCB|nr:hypothetical protein [Pedobacter sp. Leaf194]
MTINKMLTGISLGFMDLFFLTLNAKCTMVKFHYDTLTTALHELIGRGFNLDFNLEQNSFFNSENGFNIDDFQIVDIYRYEGETDPADEISLYAIESNQGKKGFFLAIYGALTDEYSTKVLHMLKGRKY